MRSRYLGAYTISVKGACVLPNDRSQFIDELETYEPEVVFASLSDKQPHQPRTAHTCLRLIQFTVLAVSWQSPHLCFMEYGVAGKHLDIRRSMPGVLSLKSY